MKILKTVQKVPGGLMVIPLLLGVFINTCFPWILDMGGLTTALWGSGAASTGIAITCFCVGTQINVRQAGEVLRNRPSSGKVCSRRINRYSGWLCI